MSLEAGGPTLTGKQAAALGVVGASVALSAGAGCGKTRVLTERYLRFLEGPDRRPLRSVVALTFTDKAARELRDRVRRACRARLDRGEEPAYWRSILRGLEAAPIGTFHAFCGSLLRRFPIEAGVEPGFAVLEESIAPSHRDAALADALRGWLATGDADLAALAVEYGLPAVRQALADLVADRGGRDYRAWSARGVEEVLDGWRRAWSEHARPRLLDAVREATRPVLDLFDRHACSHEVMNERIASLRENLGRLGDGDGDDDERLKTILGAARVQGGGTKAHWPSPEVFDRVRDGLAAFREAIKSCLERLAVDEAASAQAAEHGLRFARLAAGATEVYERHKRERGALDFDDLLARARDLLCDGPSSVREALRSEIEVLLVDEFQDTDPVQAEILERLAGPGLCDGRVFLVGDTKQSIYRFRGAQPRLFGAYRERFPDAGRLDLTENFRSAPGVVAFVNALFSGPFPEAEHRLEARSSGFAPREGSAVEFAWPFDPEHADGRGKLSAAAARAVEARWLAQVVAARLAGGWPIWDESERRVRDAHAGDVVFLLRTLNDAAAYENALAAEGLDYYVVGGSAFFAQQEVIDLINLLTTLEDPLDAVALAAVLRSPFFGLSDEGLYWLVHAGAGDLGAGLDRAGRVHDLSETDRRRAVRAGALLTAWRGLKDRVPIAGLLDRALDESGYEAALMGEHLGPRKRANARKLVRLARRFDAQGGFTLADFVGRLRADLRRPPREEQASTTDEQGRAVRLMSIHQAKGLEFPIVVVPDLDREAPGPTDRVAFHPELGVLARPPDDGGDADESGDRGTGRSLGWTCYRTIERAEEEAEAIRLLYVACTRARESLVLSAGLAPDDAPRSPALRLIASRFDLATGALLDPRPGDPGEPLVRVLREPPPSTGGTGRRARPRVLAVARAIERASGPSSHVGDPSKVPSPPAPGRLDLDPALGLDPLAARLDRLLRAILAEPEALEPSRLADAAGRASRAVVPSATPALVERAVGRLARWLDGRLGRAVRRAAEVRRPAPWRLAWPPDGSRPTVVVGALDLAFREDDGGWTLLGLSDARSSAARERLRLILSARAFGLGPVARGWLVRFGADGDASLSGEEAFDDAAVARAFREATAAGPGR